MKSRLTVLLLSIVLFHASCQKESIVMEHNRPLTQMAYYKMLQSIQNELNVILKETKPINLNLSAYKLALLSGEKKLSEEQQIRILKASKVLIDYATKLAASNEVYLEDLSSTIAFGGLYAPNDVINRKFHATGFIFNHQIQYKSTSAVGSETAILTIGGEEVLDCAIEALGIDAIYALSSAGLTSWTGTAIAKAFSSAAKRTLGPVGVAIAVVSFGICIAQEIND